MNANPTEGEASKMPASGGSKDVPLRPLLISK